MNSDRIQNKWLILDICASSDRWLNPFFSIFSRGLDSRPPAGIQFTLEFVIRHFIHTLGKFMTNR